MNEEKGKIIIGDIVVLVSVRGSSKIRMEQLLLTEEEQNAVLGFIAEMKKQNDRQIEYIPGACMYVSGTKASRYYPISEQVNRNNSIFEYRNNIQHENNR